MRPTIYTPQFIEKIINKFVADTSIKSIAEFSDKHNINPHYLSIWCRQYTGKQATDIHPTLKLRKKFTEKQKLNIIKQYVNNKKRINQQQFVKRFGITHLTLYNWCKHFYDLPPLKLRRNHYI